MPQLLAGLIVGLIGVTGVAATILTAVLTLGIGIGLTSLIKAVFGPPAPKPSDGQQTVRAAIGTRRRHYGIVHTGGQETFFESSAGTLGRVITLGTGQEDEILEHRINDKVVAVAGDTVTDASFEGALHIYTRSGDPDQTAVAELTAKFPIWTSDHRQRGCALAAIIGDPVKQEKFSKVYAGGVPQYTQVRKAARLYDPRLDSENGGDGPVRLDGVSTWPWNDNAALVIADYFAHPDGYGAGYDRVNWANIAAEADLADAELVTASAETIRRWRIWASYGLASDERRQVLANMLKAVDGYCWQDADGKFNLMLGRYEAPGITITDDHILGMTATLGPKAQHRVSGLKMLYTEASLGYRENESAIVEAEDPVEDPNTDPQAVQVYFAPHHNQAMRVGKIMVRRLGLRWHLELVLNLYGLNLLGRRFVRVESAALGIAADFAVDGGIKLNLAQRTISAALVEIRADDWDFDEETEEGTPPETPTPSDPAADIEVPTGLALVRVPLSLGSTSSVAIEASWDATTRADLNFQVRYRAVEAGTWTFMSVDNDARIARSSVVDSGVEYEVQVRSVTVTGAVSDWSAAVSDIMEADVMLSAPTSLVAYDLVGEAEINFSMPPQPSVTFARLYHHTTAVFGSASPIGGDMAASPGELVIYNHTGLSPGNHYYWARAFDGAGGFSDLAGPVSVNVS